MLVQEAKTVPLFAWLFVTIRVFQAAAASTSKNIDIAVTHGSSTAPSVTASNYTPHAGDTITVTYNPGNRANSDNDVIQMFRTGAEYSCNGDGDVSETTNMPSGYKFPPNGPSAITLKIPNVASVEPEKYVIGYMLGGAWQCPPIATSAVITVPPTLPPYNYPSTGIPSDVTAYPSSVVGTSNWPNPPNRVLTVCPAGPPTCQYSTFSAAVYDAGFTNPVDYTQIKVDCGTYYYNNQSGDWRSDGTLQHLWVYGHCSTGVLPHFIQDPHKHPGNGGSLFSFIDQSYQIYELIVDNLEVSNWQHAGAAAPAIAIASCNGDKQQWVTLFRNVYLHDTGQGIFKNVGQCSWSFTMLNSHIARTGGVTGPAHGIYLSNQVLPNNPTPGNFTAKHSVFEQTYYGHLAKSHATSNIFDCDVFIKDYSEGYGGAKAIETEQGGYVEQITNSLYIHGPYWCDNYQSNEFGLGYAAEWTGGYVALPNMYMSMNNSIYINDDDGTQAANHGRAGVPIGQYGPFDSSHVPTAWHNNTFIGPYGLWDISYQPMTAPVINWCWDGGQQQNCVAAGYVNNNTQVNLGCGAPPQGATNYVCPQDQPANGLGNLFYSTRASAALHNWPSSASPLGSMPSVDNGAVVGWPLDRTKFPIPAACTQPIGNVAPPRS